MVDSESQHVQIVALIPKRIDSTHKYTTFRHCGLEIKSDHRANSVTTLNLIKHIISSHPSL